jgi:hypothetical protein
MRRITALSIVLATIGLVGFPGGAGAATGVGGALAGDQVYGQWEDPVFVGTLLDGATGLVYPPGTVDTSTSASYSLGSATPGSPTTITWGTNTCSPCTAPISSSVAFTGDVIPAGYDSEVFPIGSFNYTNGSSVNGSESFGAIFPLDPSISSSPRPSMTGPRRRMPTISMSRAYRRLSMFSKALRQALPYTGSSTALSQHISSSIPARRAGS